MNRLAKRDLVIGTLLMLIFVPPLIYFTFKITLATFMIPLIVAVPAALGLAFFSCALIKRDQNEFEYIHGVTDHE